jgi:hypothetical protein
MVTTLFGQLSLRTQRIGIHGTAHVPRRDAQTQREGLLGCCLHGVFALKEYVLSYKYMIYM